MQPLARGLCSRSLAWAKTLTGSVLGREAPQIEDLLFPELLAYALSLLESRLEDSPRQYNEVLIAAVKQECARLAKKRKTKSVLKALLLTGATRSGGESRYQSEFLACRKDSGRVRDLLTREAFDQFRASTGLSSEVLVGRGDNLAALVFYIVLHAVLSSEHSLTREQVLRLLRGASQCRKQLETLVTDLLTRKEATEQPLVLQGPTGSMRPAGRQLPG